jgi:hypothetical protein
MVSVTPTISLVVTFISIVKAPRLISVGGFERFVKAKEKPPLLDSVRYPC